jgi:hypothetical protein
MSDFLSESFSHLLHQIDDVGGIDDVTAVENILDALSWYLDAELDQASAAERVKRLSSSLTIDMEAGEVLEKLLEDAGESTAKDLLEEYNKMEDRIVKLEEQIETQNEK